MLMVMFFAGMGSGEVGQQQGCRRKGLEGYHNGTWNGKIGKYEVGNDSFSKVTS
jgi:hypothetical protein